MITLKAFLTGELTGSTINELDSKFKGYDRIRQIERLSIRQFMEKQREYLKGDVLDFGAGTQPYKDLVQGNYIPFEKGHIMPSGLFDCIMCNQVTQYIVDITSFLAFFYQKLKPEGHLVMTYATNWDEVESLDYTRYTMTGMDYYMARAGLTIIQHEQRACVSIEPFKFPLGYGIVARKK